jgi:hypothetical protein
MKACVIGTPGCSGSAAQLHRVKLDWKAPAAGDILRYRVYRATGGAIGAGSALVEVGATANGTITTLVDTEELPNGVSFTYLVKAELTGGLSGASNYAPITAINNPPIAQNNAYGATSNKQLPIAAPGVLGNDSDADSQGRPLVAVKPQITGPSNGILTFNADGSFNYKSNPGFSGTDTFTYTVAGGKWPRNTSVPLSADSAAATVTITVAKGK